LIRGNLVQWPVNLNNVTIYTNPANDMLTVKSPVGSDITIYNVIETSIKSIKKISALFKMTISDLSSRLCIVRVTNDNKIIQSKLIKN
jgi:hypothetical protein